MSSRRIHNFIRVTITRFCSSSVDALWHLTTMPLSMSLPAIAVGFIARTFRQT
jgi:hypothetical protein